MAPTPSTPQPLVSVIVPLYNGTSTIDRALQSVVDQDYPVLECIVVDDGSRDDSLVIARGWQTRYPDRIQVLTHSDHKNRGVAATRNLAIRHSQGTYIAFLDCDDAWHRDKVSKQVAYMEAHPDIGLTYTKAAILRDEHTSAFIAGVDVLGHAPPKGRGLCMTQILTLSLNYIFSTIMVRADTLKLAGLFDEDLTYQSEDRILVARISAITDIRLIPEVLCDYHAHGDNYSSAAMKSGIVPAIFMELRSRVAVWLKGRNELRPWTRGIVYKLLPDTFVAALLSARADREKQSIKRNLCAVVRAYPLSLPCFAYALVKHSRVGMWLGLNRVREEADESSSHVDKTV
jgi:glycosyltransferase involved in cell wall biosynthesis